MGCRGCCCWLMGCCRWWWMLLVDEGVGMYSVIPSIDGSLAFVHVIT